MCGYVISCYDNRFTIYIEVFHENVAIHEFIYIHFLDVISIGCAGQTCFLWHTSRCAIVSFILILRKYLNVDVGGNSEITEVKKLIPAIFCQDLINYTSAWMDVASDSAATFGWPDYLSFTLLLTLSSGAGVACAWREQGEGVSDYLLGGKRMKTIPVALSLIATYVSGVTVIGTPSEIFNYGSQYLLVVIGVGLSAVAVAVVYLPVFCTLRLNSSYEYLELRFNRHVRAAASLLFLLDEILFLPMVVYVPALAFNQMTGVSVFTVGAVMVVICGAYTVLGGLRAVVWTDVWQIGVMFGGVALVCVLGASQLGGLRHVLDVARDTGHLEFFNLDPSPLVRQSAWGAVVGGFFYWTSFNSVNQTMVQRYLALPQQRQAVFALFLFSVGAGCVVSLCALCGVLAWVRWVEAGCPAYSAPPADDRLMPAFVAHVSAAAALPGFSGVFLAGVFGAGLSSLSAVLNACALVALEDVARGWLRARPSARSQAALARGTAAGLAALALLLLLFMERLGGVLSVATALSAIAASTTCGVFTLGMLVPWGGSRGALGGAVAGAAVAGWAALGAQWAATQGFRHPTLPLDPLCATNATIGAGGTSDSIDPETWSPFFRMSYHWIAPLGLLTTLFVGALVSYFADNVNVKQMDPELYSPVIHRLLPRETLANAGLATRHRAPRGSSPAAAPGNPTVVPLLHNPHGKMEMIVTGDIVR